MHERWPVSVFREWRFTTGGRSAARALAIGLGAALAYAALAQIRLSAQGLYYDEIHQAPAAYTYQGKWSPFFSLAHVRGRPLLTTTYSGAIKPAIYGLYLRLTGASFTVESWRWLGIAMVAATFPLFSVLARREVSPAALVLFFVLLLTDASIVLETRHDWGPVALALALRMTFLGVWLRGESDEKARPGNSLVLGWIVGFSVFEKLSSLVLLPVLALILLSRERRTIQHWGACLAGCLLGVSPLLYANLLTVFDRGWPVSTEHVAVPGPRSLATMAAFAVDYLALADGAFVRRFVLGRYRGSAALEATLLGSALLAVVGLSCAAPARRLPSRLVACYLAIGTGLYLIPNQTGVYHWVIGTPFQYLAIATGAGGHDLPQVRLPRLALACRGALLATLGALLIARVHGTLDVASALTHGATSRQWDPSLTRLGELGAERAGHDLFLAANWGVAIQIYCLSGGELGVVREPYWSTTTTPLGLVTADDLKRYRSIYLVTLVDQTFPDPAVTRRLVAALESHPNLREVPIEKEFAGLAAVKVRKFLPCDTRG
jgi:hypothetical protein